MPIKSLEDLCSRAVELTAAEMEFGTSEQIALATQKGHGLPDTLYLIAQNKRHTELLYSFFHDGDTGKPIIRGGDKLARILGGIKDDKLRGFIALYTGQAISGHYDEGSIINVLDLDKPGITYSREEMQDLQTRMDIISMIPIDDEHNLFHEGSWVHLSLALSGEALQAYKSLMQALQQQTSYDFKYHAYKLGGPLAESQYKGEVMTSVLKDITSVIALEHGLEKFDEPLGRAISTGKKDRVSYVAALASELATNDKKAERHYYFPHLIESFIAFNNDQTVQRLVMATQRLINSRMVSDTRIFELSQLTRNAHGMDNEDLPEEQLAERVEKGINATIRLNESGLPGEVFVAYEGKGGKHLGIARFTEMTEIPEVAETFKYIARKPVPEYARHAMSNVLTHGNEELARQTALTLRKLMEIGAPKQVYKRLDTRHERNLNGALQAMEVIGSDRVIKTLRMYRGHFGNIAGVFVNALYNNPEIAEEWCNILERNRREIAAMTPEHREKIKPYFGVRGGFKNREKFSTEKLDAADFEGTINRWLDDYRKAPQTAEVKK